MFWLTKQNLDDVSNISKSLLCVQDSSILVLLKSKYIKEITVELYLMFNLSIINDNVYDLVSAKTILPANLNFISFVGWFVLNFQIILLYN